MNTDRMDYYKSKTIGYGDPRIEDGRKWHLNPLKEGKTEKEMYQEWKKNSVELEVMKNKAQTVLKKNDPFADFKLGNQKEEAE